MTNTEKQERALEHISFSRMGTWRASRKQFERTYFEGKRAPENQYMAFGKRMNQLADDEIAPANWAEESVRAQLHDIFHGTPEVKLEGLLNHKGQNYKLLGYADRILDDAIVERKSGTTKSCCKNAYRQLHYYDFIRKQAGEKPFLKGQVIWIQTKVSAGEVTCTGKVQTIDAAWGDYHLEQQENIVRQFINEIHLAYPV